MIYAFERLAGIYVSTTFGDSVNKSSHCISAFNYKLADLMNRHGNSLNDHSMIILNTVQVVKLTVFVGNRVLPRVELSGNCWAEFSLSSECLFQAVGNKKKQNKKRKRKTPSSTLKWQFRSRDDSIWRQPPFPTASSTTDDHSNRTGTFPFNFN